MFTAYCAVSALPSNRDRQVRARVQDHQDPRDTTNPDRVPVCQGAMGHVHAHAHARVQEIRGHRGIPDKTEDTDRTDSKVDSMGMDKDRTGIQGRALEYQGLLGIEGLF
ncbi:hypothetical protein [Paenibacillus sp. ISL-20]|uniref:hypothetical protein n=1 Tax=Paenibacillus sp. ISL-20 TaxID=2819163 RepID=UPI001BE4EABC|nr:hypothetical protein [Paenibacillus sp. ISL-20]